MTKTWFLIAHRSGARVFEQEQLHAPLVHVATMDHHEGRLREHDFHSDAAGRVHDRMGNHRHGVSREESAVEHVSMEFVHELAGCLRTARTARKFNNLVLVAGPRLLGHLREGLDHETQKLVTASLHKDLGETPDHDIPGHLASVIPNGKA